MQTTTLLKNATLVNEGQLKTCDVILKKGRIEKIGNSLSVNEKCDEIDLSGLHLMPGMIDDQVHFREPGLTHKATIATESRAAVAGGITSFIEQPNTVPNAITQELLEDKYRIASSSSFANYSFMLGGTNFNLDEILKTNGEQVAGIKLFLGSSTGNMLVDDPKAIEAIFSNCPLLIAVHCEDEGTIRRNLVHFKEKFGENIPIEAHPLIRSEEACYISSSTAIAMAQKAGARLHVFHLSTEKETHLFRNDIPLEQKKITAEVCIHHLWFSDADYAQKGNFIKWNPAVKTAQDRDGLWKALLDDRIDVIATDHAPHTLEEKQQGYSAPSGGPLVQHALLALLDKYHEGVLSLEQIVQKFAHNPARLFQIRERGFVREGYHADLVAVDLNKKETVTQQNLLYKCGWSPFDGHTFKSKIAYTFVNGTLMWNGSVVTNAQAGQRLLFNRK